MTDCEIKIWYFKESMYIFEKDLSSCLCQMKSSSEMLNEMKLGLSRS